MAECMTPFFVKNNAKDEVPVPCGKCPNCAARRASAWSFRLYQEAQVSESAHFITLTYDTKHVPITRNGFMGLEPEHLTKFFKLLRFNQSGSAKSPIKYYAVGEYGSDTFRPHYHLCLFNARLDLILGAWGKGHVDYGGEQLTPAHVGYTLKYISKPKRIPMHKNDDRIPEFSRMSKGLGASYINNPDNVEWHWRDPANNLYCTTHDGKKIAMPRYYKQKLFTPEEMEVIGQQSRALMAERYEDWRKPYIERGEDPYVARDQAYLAAFKRSYKQALEGTKL